MQEPRNKEPLDLTELAVKYTESIKVGNPLKIEPLQGLTKIYFIFKK